MTTNCDYCDEGLPLWHRREGDEWEPAQIIPCSFSISDDELLLLIAKMISAGFSRQEITLVRLLANGRITNER